MANLQNCFQEIVTCTATLKFRVQIIQKVGSSTEIKVRLYAKTRIKRAAVNAGPTPSPHPPPYTAAKHTQAPFLIDLPRFLAMVH